MNLDLFAKGDNVKGVEMAIMKGNSYATDYLLNHFPNSKINSFPEIYIFCVDKNLLVALKVILNTYLKNSFKKEIIKDFMPDVNMAKNKVEFLGIFKKILNEIE
ncbi:hypothetical protein M9Y10_015275 [Tritrichomonas musculus]|uniref:Ankyrin repeat protein n=1 Tax=Tritrichomonas musculus TaxID=1915356 RepID=A0ABR2L2P3_9EUKA